MVSFDEKTRVLEITSYLTDRGGKETTWVHEPTRFEILLAANIWFECFPYQRQLVGNQSILSFPQISKYRHEIIWKGKKVFTLEATREEIDQLPWDQYQQELYDDNRRLLQDIDTQGRQLTTPSKKGKDEEWYHRQTQKIDMTFYEKVFTFFPNKKVTVPTN